MIGPLCVLESETCREIGCGIVARGVVRAIKVEVSLIIFGHALYFSEDLLLPPKYFPIAFKEFSSIILAQSGVGAFAPYLHVATPLVVASLLFTEAVGDHLACRQT